MEQTNLKPLFNPNTEDFVWEFLDDDNNSVEVRLPALEITYLPPSTFHLVSKHLVDYIYHKRGQVFNAELDMENIRKEIEDVDLL